mmetsp:Transcript_24497/g.72672  ORF Transcript_24497/g.72672 Transcript_24497/m.72672 type:complete len:205 (-) Transcript_24497:26-640(-)
MHQPDSTRGRPAVSNVRSPTADSHGASTATRAPSAASAQPLVLRGRRRARLRRVMEKECESDDHVQADESKPLKPVGAARGQHRRHAEDGEHEAGRLEGKHVERERLAICPRREHRRREAQQRDLRRRPDRDSDGEVGLVPDGEHDRGRVLGGVSDDGQQDGGDERQWNLRTRRGPLDRPDNHLGQSRRGSAQQRQRDGRLAEA